MEHTIYNFTTNFLRSYIIYYDIFVLLYFMALNYSYLFLLLIASRELYYYKRIYEIDIWSDESSVAMPEIAVLIPTFNEEPTITENIRSLLKLDYPNLEILIINDGSTDRTLEVIEKEFRLFPVMLSADKKIHTKPLKAIYRSAVDSRILVIDKENGGKADSLNVGIVYARSRLFCSIDADTIIERDALMKLAQAYLNREKKVVALGGIVRIANGCKVENGIVREAHLPRKILPALQVMEYIRAFLCGRSGWNRLNSLLIISGAFGLFERKSVLEAGGYRTDTIGEDMELVVRLHRLMIEKKRKYKIAFIPDPVCWTQAPESLRVLGRQRKRWQIGLIQTLYHHRTMICNPRYRHIGLFIMPYFLIFEMLGPALEISGFLLLVISFALGWVNTEFVFLFLAVSILFGILLSLFALLLEEFTMKRYEKPSDIARLFLMALLDNLGYRQINAVWRVQAFFSILRKKTGWGSMERSVFQVEDDKKVSDEILCSARPTPEVDTGSCVTETGKEEEEISVG